MSLQNVPDENDFIIADEDEPMNVQSKHVPAAKPAAHNQVPSGNSNTANFSWAPQVDLLAAFAPFVASSNFLQTNKISERRFAGGDTLDEPVLETLKRDLAQIGRRVAQVVWPAQLQALARTHQARLVALAAENGLRVPELVAVSVPYDDDEENEGNAPVALLDWDLWGPLVFLLAYAVTMGVASPSAQTNAVFSGTFSFMWLFFLVAGVNIQLLGGTISFLSAISATGYLCFPIVAGAVVCTLTLRWRLARLIVMVICALWSTYAASMSLKCLGVLPGRVVLAIYPVMLMYAVLSWLVVIT